MRSHHGLIALKRKSRILIYLLLPVVSFSLSLVLLQAHASYQQPKKVASAVDARQGKKTVIFTKPPTRLAIEGIHVNALVKPVGLTKEGDMAIDGSTTDVAWYMGGPKPGEIGSAVIAGHYGWKSDGAGSVFNDIHDLKAGDKIATYDRQGGMTIFITRKVQRYDPSADTTEIFHSNDGKSHLNLITCDGVWNDSLRTYSQRLVVFADMEHNR